MKLEEGENPSWCSGRKDVLCIRSKVGGKDHPFPSSSEEDGSKGEPLQLGYHRGQEKFYRKPTLLSGKYTRVSSPPLVGRCQVLTGALIARGCGFREKEFYHRWQDEHISLLTTEEVRDLSKISDIVRLQTLAFLLPERVGSLLSINSLAKILSTSHATVSTWLDAMEMVYLILRVPPYTRRLSRAIRKGKKLYFWDWGILEDPGKRLENFLAVQLSRSASAWTEWGRGNFSLFFLRTKDGVGLLSELGHKNPEFEISSSTARCPGQPQKGKECFDVAGSILR